MSYMSHFSLLLWYQGNVYDNKRTFCPPFVILDITVNKTLSQSGGVLLLSEKAGENHGKINRKTETLLR